MLLAIIFSIVALFFGAETAALITLPDLLHLLLAKVIPIATGIYEVVVRVIPTVGNYSIIGKIIQFLLYISNFLNVKKK